MRPLLVRCLDKTVFPIDRFTYEPLSCGWYDAYCFTDPDPAVDYMSKTEWDSKQQLRWSRYYESEY